MARARTAIREPVRLRPGNRAREHNRARARAQACGRGAQRHHGGVRLAGQRKAKRIRVDPDIDISRRSRWMALATRFQRNRDLVIAGRVPHDPADHRSVQPPGARRLRFTLFGVSASNRKFRSRRASREAIRIGRAHCRRTQFRDPCRAGQRRRPRDRAGAGGVAGGPLKRVPRRGRYSLMTECDVCCFPTIARQLGTLRALHGALDYSGALSGRRNAWSCIISSVTRRSPTVSRRDPRGAAAIRIRRGRTSATGTAHALRHDSFASCRLSASAVRHVQGIRAGREDQLFSVMFAVRRTWREHAAGVIGAREGEPGKLNTRRGAGRSRILQRVKRAR